MKKWALGLMVLFVNATVALAAPVTIDFTSMPLGTSVSNQFSGVVFSLSGGPESGGPPQVGDFGGEESVGLANSTTNDYPTAQTLIATFTGPTSGINFTFSSFGFNTEGDGGAGGNFYSVFDTTNNLLLTGFLIGNGTSYDLTAYTNVGSIQFDNNTAGNDSWYQSLGSLTFDNAQVGGDAPELNSAAATLPLAFLGIGLALVASGRKRAIQA